MNKEQKLARVHTKWLKACTCELRKTATQGVPGHGSAEAQIVFIGEAPGKTEDLSGLPFVGASGKFLDKMLGSVKLKREDVYITSIVKYRPPNNRDPSPKEVKDCTLWLQAELEVIKPKLIVFLGRHALHWFFPEEKIGEVHGTLLKKKTSMGSNFFALYHPAAALYNGSMRLALEKDFKKLSRVLKSLERV